MHQTLGGARILVTGSTGFLGQYVTPALSAAGASVVGVSKSLGFDLRNEAEVLTAALLAKPNIVVHLAASRADKPAFAFKDDVLMGLNVVNASSIAKAKLVVLCNEYAVEDGEKGAASRTLLSALRAYKAQYSIPYAVLVAQRAYGAGDALVSGLARLFLDAAFQDAPGVSLAANKVSGMLALTHAIDIAKAVVSACSTLEDAEPVTLPGEAISFNDLAKEVAGAAGYKRKVELEGEFKKNGIHKILSGQKASTLLSWHPETPLKEGIAQTVDWCRQVMSGGVQ